MDSYICNPSSLLHIHWIQLRFAPYESWDYQSCLIEANALTNGKSSVSDHHISRKKLVQKTTVLSYKFIRDTTPQASETKEIVPWGLYQQES